MDDELEEFYEFEELKLLAGDLVNRLIFMKRFVQTLPIPTPIVEKLIKSSLHTLFGIQALAMFLEVDYDLGEAECWRMLQDEIERVYKTEA